LNNIYSYVTSNKTIVWLTIIVSVLFVLSLFGRYIYIDDAWFGEQAYWFSKLGYVRVPSIIDYYDWENRLFVYHKLNIIIGAGLLSVFGWSPEPLRLFTLFVYLVFLFVVFKGLKISQFKFSKPEINLVLFFIIVNPQTFLYAYTYRPEILVMALGFFSFLLLYGKQTYLKVIFSAILAGLALLVHLNGAMFIVSGFVFLLIRKEIKLSLVFGFFATFISIFYLYDLLAPGNFTSFLFQIKHWPDDITTNLGQDNWTSVFLSALIKLSNEHQRFFWSHDVWGLSAMAVFAVIAKGKALWRKHKEIIIYLIVADLSLNLFGSHIAEVNMLLLLPFLALVSAAFVSELRAGNNRLLKLITLIIILFQFSVVIYGFADISSKREATTGISEEILSDFLDTDEKVLIPYRLIFNQLPTKKIISYKTMEYHQVENGKKYTRKEFIELANQLGIYYMVVVPEMYSNNKSAMYPWMYDEFNDIEESDKYIKLSIKSGNLKIID